MFVIYSVYEPSRNMQCMGQILYNIRLVKKYTIHGTKFCIWAVKQNLGLITYISCQEILG